MSNVLEQINKAKRIGITGHIRPDGDCLGAATALYNYIIDNYPDKSVSIHLESVPSCFEYLPGSELVDTDYPDKENYELFICLDSGDLERIGNSLKYFDKADCTVVIDHHISNIGYGQYNHVVDDASSACEVLFELMDYNKISYNTAVCLYTGMIHDTGVFKHSNTSMKTMNIAGKLISKGVPFSRIIDESFYQKTYMQNQLLGECLIRSQLKLDERCIVTVVDKALMESYSATSSDLDGVIDQLRITKGTEVAVLLHEIGEDTYKVSMRANNDVNVSVIAQYFGGGGHIKAAGCTLKGELDIVLLELMEQIDIQLKRIYN